MRIPSDVKKILSKLHKSGHEAYIVGGCVRDMMLGTAPHDYDMTTSAEPEMVKRLFPRTIDTGIEHGTVTVMMGKEGYEVTTYRVDGDYLDNRRPSSVEFTKSLTEDLRRRDFTINAMAYNEEEGIIDLFSGQQDLEKGVIRCVGDATERFSEDALRMLRAIRFAAQFGYDIHKATKEAIVEQSHLIKKISAERLHMELTKTLCSPHPEYMAMLAELKILAYVLPEFIPCIGLKQNHPYHIYDVDIHTYQCLRHIEGVEALRWAVYLHDIGKGYTRTTDEKGVDHFYGHSEVSVELAGNILKRLKFDNKTKQRILSLIASHDYRFKSTLNSVRKAMAKVGPSLFLDYMAVQRADIMGQAPDKKEARLVELKEKRALYKEILKLRQCVTIGELAVNGNDLIALGLERGKGIGDVLNHLLTLVLDKPESNQKALLLQEAKRYLSSRGNHEVH